MHGILADLVVLLHAAFVLFVAAGGLLVWRWPRLVWVHLPALVWGVGIEWSGAICPLTPLEIWLRERAGQVDYRGDFVDHYVMPILYPVGLTRERQLGLGVAVILLNLVIYGWWLRRCSGARWRGDRLRRHRGRSPDVPRRPPPLPRGRARARHKP